MMLQSRRRHAFTAVVLGLTCTSLASCSSHARVVAECGSGHWTPAGPSSAEVFSLATDSAHRGHVFVSVAPKGTEYQSLDDGGTWNRIGALPPDGTGMFALGANGSAVYFGSYRSLDGGVHWSHLPHDPAEASYEGEIVVDPRNPQVLLGRNPEDPSQLLRSSDAGSRWTGISFVAGGLWAVQGFAFDPIHPGTAYALAAQGAGALLFESRDDGATWESIGPASGSVGGLMISASGTFYSFNRWDLAISHDRGRTFQALPRPVSRAVSAIIEDPNDKETLFAATQPGAFESHDEGVTWRLMTGIGHVTSLAFDPQAHTLFAGTWHGLYECSMRG